MHSIAIEIEQMNNLIVSLLMILFFSLSTISNSVRVPSRSGSVKIEMKGIFVGAKVVQGHDWEWGCQDGGENHSIFP